MFDSSCELEDEHLTISVGSLAYIYNQLAIHLESVGIADFDEDPLVVTVRELCVNGHLNEIRSMLLEPDVLQQKLNLRIDTKLLVHTDAIVKCGDCQAPVTEYMIPRR